MWHLSRKPIFAALMMTLIASCGHAAKNRGSREFYNSQMKCTSMTDPNCLGQGGARIQIPLGTGTLKALTGRCEMVAEDAEAPKPCEGVSLVFRSSHEGQERAAIVKGFSFKVENLAEDTYQVKALTVDNQELETEAKDTLSNPSSGQNVKIRVRAKPRP